VNPPMPGEPSYDAYVKEKKAVLQSLAERAKMVAETFNSIEGVSCNKVQGAMYAFPKVQIFSYRINNVNYQVMPVKCNITLLQCYSCCT
jgi:aspartate/methionine/tyrosine aminotransferase